MTRYIPKLRNILSKLNPASLETTLIKVQDFIDNLSNEPKGKIINKDAFASNTGLTVKNANFILYLLSLPGYGSIVKPITVPYVNGKPYYTYSVDEITEDKTLFDISNFEEEDEELEVDDITLYLAYKVCHDWG